MAATGPGDSLWADSSRGPAVDVSMPGSCVHVAAYAERDPIVRTGHGTSFAVAHLAAAAAALAGPPRSEIRWSNVRNQADPGRIPGSAPLAWRLRRTSRLGSGLRTWPGRPARPAGPLPAPGDLEDSVRFGTRDDDALGRIAAMIGQDRERIRIRLAELLKVSASELNRTISEHEGELVYLVLADRAFAERLRDDAIGAFPPPIKTAGVTGELAVRHHVIVRPTCCIACRLHALSARERPISTAGRSDSDPAGQRRFSRPRDGMSNSDSSWSMSIASSRACRCSPRSSAGTSRSSSEHAGDARPDTLVYLRVRDAEQLAATLGVPTEDNRGDVTSRSPIQTATGCASALPAGGDAPAAIIR